MLPRSFLAIHDTPGGDEPGLKAALLRVVEKSHELGVRPLETIYSLDKGRAYTLVEGESEIVIREAYAAAGVDVKEIIQADRLFPDIMDAPRRAR